MAADRIILGENVAYSTDCNETGLNNNVLVCGGSGCGKTMSVSEAKLLETFNSSLIVTVTKRRIVNKYKSLFRQRGYEVLDLNFVNPAESDVSFDPLSYIKRYSDITFLAEAIVKSNPRKEKSNADPYWEDAATSLLSAEIALTLMEKEDANFGDVLNLHDSIVYEEEDSQISTSLDDRFSALMAKDPSCFAVSCWKSFCQLPIKTASCVFGTLNATIDTIFTPELRKTFEAKKNVDFESLASKKTILFVSTSAVNTGIHCFVNMFYAQAFKSLFEYGEKRSDGKLPIPVQFLCDDFATGCPILNFPEYISVIREKQISVIMLVQSESQLEKIYSANDSTTIIDNCDTYLFMGGMDLKTARSVSERLNAPLEDVLYMPIGQEFIFRRGQKPIITNRYNIRNNEQYRKITESYEKEMENCSR